MIKQLLALSTLIFLPLQAVAWWEVPHLLIAQIAYEHLNPKVKEEVDRLSRSPGRSPYSEVRFDAAKDWMDANRTIGLNAFGTWHFMNLPYAPTHSKLPKPTQQQDAHWALEKAFEVLGKPDAEDIEKAFMLRILAQVAGDMHQPLHVTTLYNSEFPNGDEHGISFKFNNVIINEQKLPSLYDAWDYACGEFPQLKVKEDKVLYETLPKLSKLLQEQLPREDLENDITTEVDVWVNESFELGKKDVYNVEGTPLKPGLAPAKDYFQNCRDTSKRQVALAGYRLAAVLNEIMGKK